jgi:hypothetical protein
LLPDTTAVARLHGFYGTPATPKHHTDQLQAVACAVLVGVLRFPNPGVQVVTSLTTWPYLFSLLD